MDVGGKLHAPNPLPLEKTRVGW